jgi:hypothetical protein
MEEGKKGSRRQATEKTNAGADLQSVPFARLQSVLFLAPITNRRHRGKKGSRRQADILKPDACSL